MAAELIDGGQAVRRMDTTDTIGAFCDHAHAPKVTAIIIIIIIIIIIPFNICKEIGVQLDKKHWYEHVPNSVVTNQGGKVTIL